MRGQQYMLGTPLCVGEWEEMDNYDTEALWALECPIGPFFFVLRLTDVAECCGKEEAAEMSEDPAKLISAEISLVLSFRNLPPSEKENILSQCEVNDINELVEKWGDPRVKDPVGALLPILAVESLQYGLYAPFVGLWGEDFEKAKNAILKDFNPLMDIEPILERPVNKLGTSGLAMMSGVIHPEAGHSTTVKQANLSGECWFVQVHGLLHCLSCDERLGSDCGGQEIRKTGRNSNGFFVPL